MNIISENFFSSVLAKLPEIEKISCIKFETMPKPDYRIQRDWGMPLIDTADGGQEFIIYLGRFCILLPLKPLTVNHGS